MATIEIDGKVCEAENGKMIIEVADEVGIHIPRFCYHKKLSIAANCRMCLVEVANGRKPVPACATPIAEGMKVFTKSEEAVRSQKAVMEFLLINHPLDCPVCDQGGECELQDVSMGFGRDDSQYEESKRAVVDDNLGTLISTEMTRCIHCTRCVRFGDEIAGVRELGGIGRGENTQISTYVQHSMTSEVSANIIDLCPVGALTSRPFRFSARAWELSQHDGVAPHDCWGSNVHLHVRRNQLMRVVPRDNEAINETWLSDRDRFSYLGLTHSARAAKPMIKRDGQWEEVEWNEALEFAADGMARVIKHHGPEQMAAFASSSSTLEELYLLQKLMRELGVNNLDYRLQQTDFRDQEQQPVMPTSSLAIAQLEQQKAIFLVGCHVHREVPLAGVRVRKAFRQGAWIGALNAVDYDYPFGVSAKQVESPQHWPLHLARVVCALIEGKTHVPAELQPLLQGVQVDEFAQQTAQALQAPEAVIVTGALCENHPQAAVLRTLIEHIAQLSGARVLRLTQGANAAGASLAGMLPHRGVAGQRVSEPGLDVQAALDTRLKGYVLMGVEPGFDFANPYRTRQSMLAAEFVVVLSAYQHASIQDYADVILPVAPFAETSGTYLNVDKTWQTTRGAMAPFEASRPAWKVLRVLANLLQCNGFEYISSEDILHEIQAQVNSAVKHKTACYYPDALPVVNAEQLTRVGEWPLYRCDAIVRRAKPLQKSAAAEQACVRLHPKTASKLNLDGTATVSQGDIEITLPLELDARVAPGVVWVANAMAETVDLGHSFAAITIKR